MEPASSGQPAPTQTAHVRTGLVVLAALLTEIVVIGAVGNQWVTKSLNHSIANERSRFMQDFKTSLITYNWRFAPQAGDTTHILLSQALLILATLVLSAVFIVVLVRDSAGFWRTFVASWLAVVGATLLGSCLRGATNDYFGSSDRAVRAFFLALGPNGPTFMAAMLLGLIVGVVAGAVAVSTRRSGALVSETPVADGSSYFAPEQPPPYYGEGGVPESPPWQERFAPPGRHAAGDSGATDVLPDPGAADVQLTTQLPPFRRFEPDAEQETTRFPTPPDDEDMDPHEHA